MCITDVYSKMRRGMWAQLATPGGTEVLRSRRPDRTTQSGQHRVIVLQSFGHGGLFVRCST